jgi:predicted hydrolase (HD superfamily)
MIVWDLIGRTQKMKGKRHTTEGIRILRKADGGKSILDVSREHNISEQTVNSTPPSPGRW